MLEENGIAFAKAGFCLGALMDVQKVDTDLYAEEERAARWRAAMAGIHLPVLEIENPAALRGSIIARQSALGTRISVVKATGQILSGGSTHQPDGTWLLMILAGEGVLESASERQKICVGDIIYGRTASAAASMSFNQPFEMISLVVPPMIIDPRLIGPIAPTFGYLPAGPSVTKVFSNLLVSFADALEQMQQDELRPVELSLAQFLISCIVSNDKSVALGGAAANRAAHLSHIRLKIESMLGNPDLDTKLIADDEGVSVRYLQKLFSSSGDSFAKYVHQRRLERCRQDLISPASAALTITEICFRWGFNSSAHFSRAFRHQYGVSPRDYRTDAPAPL